MYTHTESRAIIESIIEESIVVGENVYYLTDVTYVGFAAYTIFIPEILKEFALVAPKQRIVDVAWNYVDAACITISSIALLFKDTARPVVDKSKASFNLIGAAQLITLTIIGLDVIGFLIATLVGLIISLFETADLLRCKYDKEYWRAVTKANIRFYERHSGDLKKDIATIKNIDTKQSCIQGFLKSHILDKKAMRLNKNDLDLNSSKIALTHDNPNHAQINKDIRLSLVNNVFWASTFTGLLLIEIPSLEIIGLALIAFAITTYLVQYNHDKIDTCIFGEVGPVNAVSCRTN